MATSSWLVLHKPDVQVSADQGNGFSVSRASPPVLLSQFTVSSAAYPLAAAAIPPLRVLAADLSAGLFLLPDRPNAAAGGYTVLNAANATVTYYVHGPDDYGPDHNPDPTSLGGTGFMVVGIECVDNTKVWLHCYLHGTRRWVIKRLNHNPMPHRATAFDDVTAHAGRVWWVHTASATGVSGLLSCDPFADDIPHIVFSTSPELRGFCARIDCFTVPRVARRCVQVACGELRWMQICSTTWRSATRLCSGQPRPPSSCSRSITPRPSGGGPKITTVYPSPMSGRPPTPTSPTAWRRKNPHSPSSTPPTTPPSSASPSTATSSPSTCGPRRRWGAATTTGCPTPKSPRPPVSPGCCRPSSGQHPRSRTVVRFRSMYTRIVCIAVAMLCLMDQLGPAAGMPGLAPSDSSLPRSTCGNVTVVCTGGSSSDSTIPWITFFVSTVLVYPSFVRIWMLGPGNLGRPHMFFVWSLILSLGNYILWTFYTSPCRSFHPQFPIYLNSVFGIIIHVVLLFFVTFRLPTNLSLTRLLAAGIIAALCVLVGGLIPSMVPKGFDVAALIGWISLSLSVLSHWFRMRSTDYDNLNNMLLGFSVAGAINGFLWLHYPDLCIARQYKISSYLVAVLRATEVYYWVSPRIGNQIRRMERHEEVVFGAAADMEMGELHGGANGN